MASFPSPHISRRDFIMGATAGIVTLSLPEWLAGEASAQAAPRIRYEASSPKGKAMLVIYRDGVRRMKALPRHDPRSWIFQANIHAHPDNEPVNTIFAASQGKTAAAKAIIARNKTLALGAGAQKPIWNTCPHSTTTDNGYAEHFISWHRIYLMFLERTIASLTNKPTFALPYWEYSHPNAKALGRLRLPAEFRAATNNNALYSADRSVRVNSTGLTEGAVGPRDAFDQRTLLGDAGESGFNATIEDLPHNNVHGAVGTTKRINGEPVPVGMQSVELAARDPIFWVHHANIDRLWESWRRPGGNGSSQLDPAAGDVWLAGRTFAFVDPEDTSKLVKMTAGEALNIQSTKLGYKYDSLASVANATSFSSASRTARPTQLSAKDQIAQAQIKGLDQPVTVPVRPTAPAPVALGFGQRSDAEYILTIEVEADAKSEPGGLFEVYMLAPKTLGATEKVEQLVGTFNLFGVNKHAQHLPAGAKPSKTWKADITELVLRKLVDPTKPADVVFRAAFNAPTVPVTIKSVVIEAR